MTIIHRALLAESQSFLGGTLLDVQKALAIKEDLNAQVRSNMVSAINTLCRVLDRQPQHVPTALNLLRPMMDKASPGALHVSPRRWANVRSDVVRAIRLCGYAANFIPKDAPIAECWDPVVAAAPDVQVKSSIRRFARFCSLRQLSPTEVSDSLMPEYLAFLKECGSKAPETCRDDLIRQWNRIGEVHQDLNLTLLTAVNRSRTYSLEWNELPESLGTDAAAFKAAIVAVDPLAEDGRQPVRQSTADQYHRQIRRLASAALANGATASDIASLADLVSPTTLKRGLSHFFSRNGNKANQQAHDMAHLALLIAATWAKLPEDEVAQIKRLANKCKVDRKGLTPKNLDRLRQFRDGEVIRKLIQLPEQMLAEARRAPTSFQSAMLVQNAVALTILMNAPIRIANLRALDRTRHFVALFSTKGRGMQLVLPKEEVKNAVDLHYPLAAHATALIDVYMEDYQPFLCIDSDSTLLFPGRGGNKPKTDSKLREQIIKCVWKRLALHVNPHLFRHLCAMIFLEAHPGAYEDVRRMLGHKSTQTTINFYAGLETNAAVRLYNEILAGYRSAPNTRAAQSCAG